MQTPPSAERKRREKLTMSDHSRNSYQFGHLLGEQGPRSLLSDQDRVEKLATGKQAKTSRERERERESTRKLKLVKNMLTIGTWNVQILWATGNLKLLRREMKRFRYDIIGILEVRWTGDGETSSSLHLVRRRQHTHKRRRTAAKCKSKKSTNRIQSDNFKNQCGYIQLCTSQNHSGTCICTNIRLLR